MNKYKILLSVQAKNDYKNIIRYIKYNLLEPIIAERYVNLIKSELSKLEYQPQKFAIIDYDIIREYKIRKLIIKNYCVFYRINENDKIVNIERILYSGADWKNRL